MAPPGKGEALGVVTTDLEGKEKEERLIVRLDQPIENVELVAHTLLRGTDGGVLTPSSRKIKYRWFRSVSTRNCASELCPSKRKAAVFQSLLSLKRYCSRDCMARDTKALAEKRFQEGVLLGPGDAQQKQDICWRVRPFEEDNAWEQMCTNKMYLPTRADVGHILKVECSAVGADGSVSVKSESKESPVVIGLDERNMRLLQREWRPAETVKKSASVTNFLRVNGGGAVIRIMSYNVLADLYATRQLYSYCPLWALNWGYRRQLILKEIDHHSADVICLQEMQADHFDTYLKPQLSARGYDAVFKAKTREAMGRKGKIDGCAIVYRKSRLRIIDSQPVEYNTIAMNAARSGAFNRSELSHSENERRTNSVLSRLCRDNVGQILVLETVPEGFKDDGVLAEAVARTGPQQICVATTHIFWDPEFADVKFWQTQAMLQELSRVVGPEMPLVFTGDFNSTPESMVVQFVANDHVDPNHQDYQTDPQGILPALTMANHNLELGSAYKLVAGREPPCTNYTKHYSGVLDYIWLSTNSLTPLSVLMVPAEKTLRGEDNTHMPNSSFPSDHVSLCVDVNINSKERVRSRPTTPSPPSPSMSPPIAMSPGYEHLDHQRQLRQHQHLHHMHYSRVRMPSSKMHSPNPAMMNYPSPQPYQQQQQHGMEGRGSPGLHPLSHQQHQMHMQQQQQQEHQQNPQFRLNY